MEIVFKAKGVLDFINGRIEYPDESNTKTSKEFKENIADDIHFNGI